MSTRLSSLEKMANISNAIERMPLGDKRKAQMYYLAAVAALAGVEVAMPDVQPVESEDERAKENRELSLLLQQVDRFYGRAQQLDPTESYKRMATIAGDHTQGSHDVLRARLERLAQIAEDFGDDDL